MFDKIDNLLFEKRMEYVQHNPGQNMVLLAIDKDSLDHVGAWPWDRKIYSEILDKLFASGANEVFLDIDFSAPSNIPSDKAFADALAQSQGSVLLPAFLQTRSVEANSEVTANLPLKIFRDNAWIGSVNIIADQDGIVRNFPFGFSLDGGGMDYGGEIHSIPSILSGVTGPLGHNFPINFSIDGQKFLVFSLKKLLTDQIAQHDLANKTIIIGATAIELGDRFAVPVFGLKTGVEIQMLATETLRQGIIPKHMNITPLIMATVFLCLLLALINHYIKLHIMLVLIMVISGFIEFFALEYWFEETILAPTTICHFQLFLFATWLVFCTLKTRGWMLKKTIVKQKNTEHILQQMIKDSHDAMIIFDDQGKILLSSDNAFNIINPLMKSFGDNQIPDEMRAMALSSIHSLRARKAYIKNHDLVISDESHKRYLEYSVNASQLPDNITTEKPRKSGDYIAFIVVKDVTQKRLQELRISYLASYDELTQGMRRHAFVTELQKAIDGEKDISVLVFALNIHRFKTVNTMLGRHIGDLLLKQVVSRISSRGFSPFIASLGGDSFSFYVVGNANKVNSELISLQLIDLITTPFKLNGTVAKVGVRIGVSSKYPEDIISASELIGNAELALDIARKDGGTGYNFFNSSTAERQEKARGMEQDLWNALEDDQISISYQPQVRMKDGKLLGVEALVRWHHPQLGSISPSDFVEIAEANGFIEQLGRWILEKACANACHWPSDIYVAVNVAPLQLIRGNIYKDVVDALNKTGLEAKRLQLEITESSFVDDASSIITNLGRIKTLGVTLALDDFGTGYSSFGYLSRLPFDKIKIDQMFARNLPADKVNLSIIQSIRTLADGLNLKLICEGVETIEQANALRMTGCDEGQGYLYAKPQSAEGISILCGLSEPFGQMIHVT